MRDEPVRLLSGGQLNTTVKSDEGSFAIWAVVLILAEDSLLFLPYFSLCCSEHLATQMQV